MFLLSTSHSNNYHLKGRLVGHKNAINCLAVSRNGNMLASGVSGSDRMRIWDLKRRVQLPTPPQTPAVRNPTDPVTCTCWITRHEATCETLCYGTGLGFIGIWQQQGEVNFHRTASRNIVVFGMYDGEIHPTLITSSEVLRLGNGYIIRICTPL
ncbi:hypothetical protein DFH29DRAFT_870160 [Suillus ampliporus]|nr:hypothetical protein DFH29DRAFT_870160 [Suillus ampliporus]